MREWTESELIETLRSIAATKTGDPLPPLLQTPNGWGEPLSELLNAAADMIEWLQQWKP